MRPVHRQPCVAVCSRRDEGGCGCWQGSTRTLRQDHAVLVPGQLLPLEQCLSGLSGVQVMGLGLAVSL